MRFLPPQLPGAALPLLAVLVLALAAPQAQAQWKWRDRTGQINVSDRPPPLDVPDKDILSRPTPENFRLAPAATASATSAPALARAAPADRELEARKRAAEQEKATKARAEDERLLAQRSENCRRARGQLATLESGQRIARANDKGEREVLDDRARAEEMRLAREVIGTDCR
jgi:hypothetical protein